MATSTMVQMNVRMDRDLKTRGDAALADIGFSPSEAVRALWVRVAQRGADAAAVQQLLSDGAATSRPAAGKIGVTPEVERRLKLIEGSAGLVQKMLADAGDSPTPPLDDKPYDRQAAREDLLDALEERWIEREVWA